MDISNEEIARAWIKYTHLPTEKRDERIARIALFWVWEKLCELVQDEPENAWQVIRIMTSLDSSEILLANVAAGPLEDLLAYHGERFIDRVEEATRSDPTFKKMLGAVWQYKIPEEIWARVKAVAGPSF